MEDTNNQEIPKRGRGRPPKVLSQQPLLPTSPTTSSRINLQHLRRFLNRKVILTLVLLALILVPSWYFYDKQQDTKKRLDVLQAQQNDTPSELVKKVGSHVLLPEGEQPTIATVTDPAQLSGQPFFANAAKDDKVLVYNQAKRAILYRPSIDKVIESTSLNTDLPQPTTGQ